MRWHFGIAPQAYTSAVGVARSAEGQKLMEVITEVPSLTEFRRGEIESTILSVDKVGLVRWPVD